MEAVQTYSFHIFLHVAYSDGPPEPVMAQAVFIVAPVLLAHAAPGSSFLMSLAQLLLYRVRVAG